MTPLTEADGFQDDGIQAGLETRRVTWLPLRPGVALLHIRRPGQRWSVGEACLLVWVCGGERSKGPRSPMGLGEGTGSKKTSPKPSQAVSGADLGLLLNAWGPCV